MYSFTNLNAFIPQAKLLHAIFKITNCDIKHFVLNLMSRESLLKYMEVAFSIGILISEKRNAAFPQRGMRFWHAETACGN